MGNLFKALLHGSAKIKLLIIFMFILTIGGTVAFIMGIGKMSLVLLGGGALGAIVGLILMFSTTFSFSEKNQKQASEPSRNLSLTEQRRLELARLSNVGNLKGKNSAITKDRPNASQIDEEDEEIVNASSKNKKTPKNQTRSIDSSVEDNNDNLGSIQINVDDYEEDDIDTEGLNEEEIAYARKVNVQKKSNSDKYGVVKLDGEGEEEKSERHEIMYQTMDKKSASLRKKLLKVKPGDKKYTPIFVDACKSLAAYRTPAYVQVKGKEATIMLMERNIRTHVIPLARFLEVKYARNVEERSPESYDVLKEDTELYKVFEDLLPSLYPTNNVRSNTMLKNQYILANDIAISARSMRNLINKYDLKINLFDALNLKGDYSQYFKMAYENRILWTDNVITQIEYQTRIRSVLQMMVDDDEVLEYDLENDTEMMVRYKLITQEYADFYLARKRERIQDISRKK